MRYNVRIEDETGFDVIGDEYFDDYNDVLHYIKSILPYVDYYKYSATVDAIDDETGEVYVTEEHSWCVTNCGSYLAKETTYQAIN